MNESISLKYDVLDNIEDRDFDKMNRMIISTWDYRSWIPKNNVVPMAEFFLDEVIVTSSRIFVARDGDEIIGVIAASLTDNLAKKTNAKIRKYKALKKVISRKRKEIFELYLDTLILNENLLLQSGKQFEAALNFFILDERYRGLGIGNKLYSVFIDYLDEKGINEFFLWTDSSSNFQFYEKKGLRRIAEDKYSWGGDDDAESYYLYEGKVKVGH
ncbi:GNAT family N-acetyltransferase [Salmonella enterica]|nr:GNAT family N-acetyltransferase [Salmonella enterica]